MHPEGILWKNPLSSFTMCPLGSLRVLWEFVGKLSYIESLLWVLYKEPSRHIVKEQSEFVQKVPTTYLLGMSQENWWALFENNWYVPAGFGLGKSVGTFWKCPLFTHWVWARQIVSEPTINSQCTHWVYCPSPLVWVERPLLQLMLCMSHLSCISKALFTVGRNANSVLPWRDLTHFNDFINRNFMDGSKWKDVFKVVC